MSDSKQNSSEYKNLDNVISKDVYNQLPEFTRIARYAQYNQEHKRRENWKEQVERVFKMHHVKYAKYMEDEDFIRFFNFAKQMMIEKRVLGSQRALQFGGPAILNKNARIYNCSATYVDRPRVFQEIMYALLCGVGMGFSVQFHHIEKLPQISQIDDEEKKYVIPDSIEGWSDSIGVLLSSYFKTCQTFPEYFGKKVVFDYSNIRPKGSNISHMGGKAPGPEGLRKSIEKIRKLLQDCVDKGYSSLRPIDAYDILMHCSDAVLSGGIRRAATIAVFSIEDEDMINAKTGTWYIDNPQRARSNNSALLLRDDTPKEKFMNMIEKVKQFGEPGIIFTDDLETLYNPCVPDDTWVLTSEGSKQVKELINKPFTAIVNGKEYESKTGFVKTGFKNVYKIVTKEGFEVRTTDNHKILNADNEWIELKDLEIGDKITIHDHSSKPLVTLEENHDFAKGWIMGSLYGDGTFYYPKNRAYLCFWGDNRYEMRDKAYNYFKQLEWLKSQSKGGTEEKGLNVGKIIVENSEMFRYSQTYIKKGKILTDEVEKEPINFQVGFLRGIFDADGSVQGNQNKGASIRLTSNNMETLKRVQRMCLRLGVYGKIYKERRPEGDYMLPDGKGKVKLFHCNAIHEFIITRSSIKTYRDHIGFNDPEKKEKLDDILSNYKRKPSGSKYVAEIIEITCDEECDVYDCTVDKVHAFDANGFYVHNCVEVALYGYDQDGKSGLQVCNLSEINMGSITCEDDFYKSCEAAAIIGTLQAGYTDFPYLGKTTQNIVEREALIGVSMTGMMDCPDIAFNPEILKTGAERVREINQLVAKIIGINPAARTTCVKPAGSTSCILNTASGIHPRHAKRYFRRVQVNKLEEPLAYFRKYNPNAIEESVWSSGKTDDVVTFLCKGGENSLTKSDVSSIQLLEKVKLVQQYWVTSGRDIDLCVNKNLNHNVSNTITVNPDEWEKTANFIYENREYFAGISLLSSSGDMTYQQAPFQEVFTHEEITKKYGAGSVFASGLIVHAHDAFNGNLYDACACFLGYGEKLEMPKFDMNNISHSFVDSDKIYKKIRWIAQADKFTMRHFGGDKTKMTHCLKAVDAWKTWCDLKRTYQNVPWDQFFEDKDNTKRTQYLACSGNKCEIVRF
jgi:intein/homing endonuclease